MPGLDPFGLGELRRISLGGLDAVAWGAEDLQIGGVVRAAQRDGCDVIDLPALAGCDVERAALAAPVRGQEGGEPLTGGERAPGHDDLPSGGGVSETFGQASAVTRLAWRV